MNVELVRTTERRVIVTLKHVTWDFIQNKKSRQFTIRRAGIVILSKNIAVATFALALSFPAQAAIIDGKAINVADGDTITILDTDNKRYRIRINGIDAPERGQPFGERAQRNLARMVAGKEVTANCHKTDRFGRQVCKVWVQPEDCPTCGKTLEVGHAQVISGMAWWYREYAKEQTPEDRGRYESGENEARLRKRGLWADDSPVAPWDWRKAKP